MAAEHVFVDETKEKGYLVTAAALLPGNLERARRAARSLIMPRQRRVHFTSESDARRKQILDVIEELRPQATLYDSSGYPKRRQREACLLAVIEDLAVMQARMLVLETDDSIVELDRKLLYRRVRELGCEGLEYRHQRAHEEPLLMIPDAIAWCWSRGGPWRDRVRAMVVEVRTL
jgi:hypothetical protein